MRILIETPSWLGDSVMLTPTLQNIKKEFSNSEIILVGSKVSIDILQGFGSKYFILNRKGNRFLNIWKLTKEIGKIDISLSFRASFFSGLFQYFSKAKIRVARKSFANSFFLTHKISISKNSHQVEKYLEVLDFGRFDEVEKFDLKLNFKPKQFSKPTLGINAGATYGSAKRWYPEKFAEVIEKLADKYEIILFGGDNEVEINRDIENILNNRGITNIRNLAGKTTIQDLAENIGGLSLFITNDSGPMHIAGAYQIPTVSIFGSTNHIETDQWKNRNQEIVRKNMECSPCMKRECPLKHHECMKQIGSDDVLSGVEYLRTPKIAKRIEQRKND